MIAQSNNRQQQKDIAMLTLEYMQLLEAINSRYRIYD